jgi:membrane-associated PAP2 superfamily phosphatase
MLGCALLVPLLKRFSLTSCPWDLAEFGGVAAYVPHGLLGVADGGPGHCFPSGHAASAFVFLGAWFLWREHSRRVARRWLAGTLVAGVLFGAAQLARGAHYPSHTLWTAWICLALLAAFAAWRRRLKQSHP